jgi:hypothetical protein
VRHVNPKSLHPATLKAWLIETVDRAMRENAAMSVKDKAWLAYVRACLEEVPADGDFGPTLGERALREIEARNKQ